MNEETSTNGLMKPDRPVGIVGYGAYVPRYRLPATEVSDMWTGGTGGTPIIEKSVNGLDEDVATMSVEAARNTLLRAICWRISEIWDKASRSSISGTLLRISKRRLCITK